MPLRGITIRRHLTCHGRTTSLCGRCGTDQHLSGGTLAGSLSGALKQSPTLQFTNFDIGFANSGYLAGAVLGALGFGWLTDRIGRKKLFFITLAVYLFATAATALSWNLASFALFRLLTGAGIGGE